MNGITTLRAGLDRCEFAHQLGLRLDGWQRDLLRSDSDRILLNCCRQAGKSSMAALLGLHQALYFPGSLILCLAPSERQSKELFGKIVGYYRDLHGAPPAESDRKLGMALTNGSRIEALPGASEKTIRGFSAVNLLLVDEAARVDDSLFHAARPMISVSGGAMIMLSTPAGKRGAFYEMWTNGDPEWERYRITAEDCPRISPQFLEEERRILPSWVFDSEYRCVFTETEDAIFTTEMIDRSVSHEVKPLFETSDEGEGGNL